MLEPAWGYVDQPPLTPWLARTLTESVADEAWALRLPATLASAASVVLLGLIARELGGDRRAVALAAWGGAFAGLPLALGHVLLTSTIDLPLTLARGADRPDGAARQPPVVARCGGPGRRRHVEPAAHAAAAARARARPRHPRPPGAAAHPVAVARGRPGRAHRAAEPRLPVEQRLAAAGDGCRPGRVQRRRRAGRPAAHHARGHRPSARAGVGRRPGARLAGADRALGAGRHRRHRRLHGVVGSPAALPGGDPRGPLRRRVRADVALDRRPSRSPGARGRRGRPQRRRLGRHRAAPAARDGARPHPAA